MNYTTINFNPELVFLQSCVTSFSLHMFFLLPLNLWASHNRGEITYIHLGGLTWK